MAAGCRRNDTPAPAAGPQPRIACLAPGATDLLVGMGAADHLVAVSTYDQTTGPLANLPRVGNLQDTDWEMLDELRPQVLIHQMAEERVPPGFRQRAERLGMGLRVIQIERLDDIYSAITTVGQIASEPAKADALATRIRGELDAVRRRAAGRPAVRTLLVIDPEGQNVIGPDTFLDDLLTVAGGVNAAASLKSRYPAIDHEMLQSLAPEVIIQLLPEAAPQVVQQAKRTWDKMPDVPAVKNNRVYVVTDWFVLQPGSHIGQSAARLAECLHPTEVGQ